MVEREEVWAEQAANIYDDSHILLPYHLIIIPFTLEAAKSLSYTYLLFHAAQHPSSYLAICADKFRSEGRSTNQNHEKKNRKKLSSSNGSRILIS